MVKLPYHSHTAKKQAAAIFLFLQAIFYLFHDSFHHNHQFFVWHRRKMFKAKLEKKQKKNQQQTDGQPCFADAYWKDFNYTSSDDFYSQEFGNMEPGQVQIIYHDEFNLRFWGIENCHPFDSKKYNRVFHTLVDEGMITSDQVISPNRASDLALKLIHTEDHLESLKSPMICAQLAEFPPLAFMFRSSVKKHFVDPMRRHVGGTILAGQIALKNRWCISLGGGMHHAYSNGGGGWCVFSDIVLSYQHLRLAYPKDVKKVMVIDLDVHQGNGIERDKIIMNDSDMYMLDMYRSNIYPLDYNARKAIDCGIQLDGSEDDDQYLRLLREGLKRSFSEFHPDVVYFNAGTDPLIGDPLGGMQISKDAIIRRDEMVFQKCLTHQIPIVMVLSGGYTKPLSSETIASSILNLQEKFGLINSV